MDDVAHPPYIKRLKKAFDLIRNAKPWTDNPLGFTAQQIELLEQIVESLADADQVDQLPSWLFRKNPL